MQIEILSATQNPMELISLAAGTCYGKHDYKPKRVGSCFDRGHMSVFEHASITVRISGISRACSHQLVRHRVASFSQQSQRYCKINVNKSDWYVIPPEIESDKERRQLYQENMYGAALDYLFAIDDGIKPEDARYLLPEATKTEIVVSMNVRELFHFFDTRLNKSAQWEIRRVASMIKNTAALINKQWQMLIEIYEKGRANE